MKQRHPNLYGSHAGPQMGVVAVSCMLLVARHLLEDVGEWECHRLDDIDKKASLSMVKRMKSESR